MSLADLNIYKVYCSFFDGWNLHVIDMEEDLKITICHRSKMYFTSTTVESTSSKREIHSKLYTMKSGVTIFCIDSGK